MICLSAAMRPGKCGRLTSSKNKNPDHVVLKFTLAIKKGQALNILCIGAHSDDIEIGCGGTILRLLSDWDEVEINWVVFGSAGQRKSEAIASASNFLTAVKQKTIIVKNFRDGFFPYVGGEIKSFFEKLKKRVSPDIIFTHYRHDLHQDHRFISDLTWQTFRDHLILEYEIPKYDGDLGSPNFFVHLDESVSQRKIAFILENFKTQRDNHWFTRETFLSVLRLRGIESNSPHGYAEAFYCRKLVLK